jgi:hypothetical protein
MANRICRPLIKLEERSVVKVEVPSGATLYAGDVILCETLDTTDSDNLEVYAGAIVADCTAQIPCIIINQGFETLSDGRRPDGQPDPSQYSYTAGNVVTAVRLHNDNLFFISHDCLDNKTSVPPAVGVVLIPQNADYKLATAASVGSSLSGLTVEKVTTQGVGGQFGATFVNGVVARVTKGR